MRVLLDQGTPVPIRRYLGHHSVQTAAEQDWATLRNGELLAAAEVAGFDVLLTTDKNIRYQQNLGGRRLAIVVIGYPRWPGPRAARAPSRCGGGQDGAWDLRRG